MLGGPTFRFFISVQHLPSVFLCLHPTCFSTTQISSVMDKFETQFSDLDVQTSYLESAMSSTTATTTPQDQVDLLINQVADQAGLELQHELGGSKVPDNKVQVEDEERKVGEEDGKLADRLRALRVSGWISGWDFLLLCLCWRLFRTGSLSQRNPISRLSPIMYFYQQPAT